MKTRKSTLINCDAIGYKEMLVGTSENGNDLIDWGEGVWEVINKDETYSDGFGGSFNTLGYDVECEEVA